MEAATPRIPQNLTLWDGNFTFDDFEPTSFPDVLNPIIKLKFMIPNHIGQIPHIRRNLLCYGPLCKGSDQLIHGHFFHCLECAEDDLCEKCAVHVDNEHDHSHTLLELYCRPHQSTEQSRIVTATEDRIHDDEFLEYLVNTDDLRKDFPLVWAAVIQLSAVEPWGLHEDRTFKLRLTQPAENCSVYTIAYPREDTNTMQSNSSVSSDTQEVQHYRKPYGSLREGVTNPEVQHHLEFYDSLREYISHEILTRLS